MKTFIVHAEEDIEANEVSRVLIESLDVGFVTKEVPPSDESDMIEEYKVVSFLVKVTLNVPADGEYDTESYFDACKEAFEAADIEDQEALEEVDDLQFDLVAEL